MIICLNNKNRKINKINKNLKKIYWYKINKNINYVPTENSSVLCIIYKNKKIIKILQIFKWLPQLLKIRKNNNR
jgi:hypothetical protein